MIPAAEEMRRAAARLKAAGIDRPAAEARLLLAESLGTTREALIAEPARGVDDDGRARFRGWIDRRCAREPVSRIVGRREFWSLEFRLARAVLDPRPDSETLIEAALAWQPDRRAELRLLDLGTGSGCLLCSLLREYPRATGFGIDRSAAAVETATANAAALGLAGRARLRCADWNDGSAAAGPFDLIVANPPYVRRGDIDRLEPDVALFDPRDALDGGIDGLDGYRGLAPAIARALAPAGVAFVEVGRGQAGAAAAIMAEAGLECFVRRADLAGTFRCIALRRRGVDRRK